MAPFEIYAVHRGSFNNEFWHFDGGGWVKRGDANAGEILTGIDGLSSAEIVAVGRAPSTMKGTTNVGVAWRYDGQAWTESTLPPGAAGMTDVAFVVTFEDQVFANGFEVVPASKLVFPALEAAEYRAYGEGAETFFLTSEAAKVKKLRISKTLINPDPATLANRPVQSMDILTWRVTLENLGEIDETDIRIKDSFLRQTFQSLSGCPATVENATVRNLELVLSLPAGQTANCDLQFQVVENPTFNIFNAVYLRSNAYDFDATFSCSIQSFEEFGPNLDFLECRRPGFNGGALPPSSPFGPWPHKSGLY